MKRVFLIGICFTLFFLGTYEISADQQGVDLGPGPMKAFGKKIANTSALRPGTPVQVLWKGEWWLGSVVKVVADNNVKIHYYGWEYKWDEVVGLDRLLLIPESPGAIKPTGKKVTTATPLKPGDPVQVEWQGSWYLGTVMSLVSGGKVKIHYYGWSHSYDEVVPRTRLNTLPLAAEK